MLEALEEIRKAEQKIDTDKQKLLDAIDDYSKQKTAELEQQKEQNRQTLQQLTDELEQKEAADLAAEKAQLLEDAQATRHHLEEQYEKNYQQAIDMILERVKESYGSH